MGVPKHVAVAVSGLIFAGGAALAVGVAAPASAQSVSAAPQQLVSDGCCGRSRLFGSHRNFWRNNQRIIVINRNNNFSKSDTFQQQRQRQDEEDRARREIAPIVVVPRDFPPGPPTA